MKAYYKELWLMLCEEAYTNTGTGMRVGENVVGCWEATDTFFYRTAEKNQCIVNDELLRWS